MNTLYLSMDQRHKLRYRKVLNSVIHNSTLISRRKEFHESMKGVCESLDRESGLCVAIYDLYFAQIYVSLSMYVDALPPAEYIRFKQFVIDVLHNEINPESNCIDGRY